MKSGILLILLILFGFTLQAQGPDKIITCHFKGIPFTEFCDVILHQTGVRIYYKEEWTNKLSVTLDADSITVLSAVRHVIDGSGLEVSVWHDDLVVLPGAKLLTELPTYEQIAKKISPVEQKEHVITKSEERYITGRKPGVTQTITIGRSGINTGNGRVKVLGRVFDQETGEPLIFVTINENRCRFGYKWVFHNCSFSREISRPNRIYGV